MIYRKKILVKKEKYGRIFL